MIINTVQFEFIHDPADYQRFFERFVLDYHANSGDFRVETSVCLDFVAFEVVRQFDGHDFLCDFVITDGIDVVFLFGAFRYVILLPIHGFEPDGMNKSLNKCEFLFRNILTGTHLLGAETDGKQVVDRFRAEIGYDDRHFVDNGLEIGDKRVYFDCG